MQLPLFKLYYQAFYDLTPMIFSPTNNTAMHLNVNLGEKMLY